ncbi:MATE family efflux transporter [Vibrio cyclitrophicus]
MNKKRIMLALFLQYIGKILAIFISMMLAKMLGVDLYGEYAYFLSLANIIMLPVIAGIPQLILKEFGKTSNIFNDDVVNWSSKFIIINMFIISFFYTVYSTGRISYEVIFLFLYFVFSRGLSQRNSAIITACKYHDITLLNSSILQPFLFLTLILLSERAFNIVDVFYLLNYSFTISLVASYFFIFLVVKNKTHGLKNSKNSKNSKSSYIGKIIPFSLLTLITTFNVELSTLIVANYMSMSDTAIFRVASQFSIALTLSMSLVNSMISSEISKEYHSNNIKALQGVMRKSVLFNSALSFFVFIILVLFGEEVISLTFGDEYLIAYKPMLILAFGQLINAFLGSSGTLLNMAGYEKVSLKLSVFSLIFSSLSLLLFIDYGVIAAAFTSAFGLIFWKLALTIYAYKKLRIKTWVH